MPDEPQARTRRSLLKVAVAAVLAAIGLSQVASAAKQRALTKKGYVETTTKKSVKKGGKKKAGKKKAAKKKKKKKKKKAAKKKKRIIKRK